MKKPVIFLLVCVVVAAGIYVFFSSSSLEKETAPIAVADITAISKSWNGEELRKRSDPGLMKAMSSQGQSPEELLKIYSVLGRLRQPASCAIKTSATTMKGGEQHNTVSYECSAEYEKAPAVVSISLSKAESETEWLIYYINIHSDIFAQVIE